ncbi:sensor domain-containing protein [Cryobacterium arcticum]|nr:EAL domain-containing protein [Cryobacterium arcticum]
MSTGAARPGAAAPVPPTGMRWLGEIPTGLLAQLPQVPAGTAIVVHRAPDGRVIAANAAAAQLLHLTWDQLLGRAPGDQRWAPIDEWGVPLSPELEPAMQTLATGRAATDNLLGITLPGDDGAPEQLNWISVSATVATDHDEGMLAVIAVFTDVSETDRARAATRLVFAGYRALSDNITDFVLRCARDGTVLWASPAVTAATGWRPDALVGRAGADFSYPGESWQDPAAIQRLAAGDSSRGRCRFRSADGSYRWFFRSSRPQLLHSGGVTGVVHGFTDIDSLVDAENSTEIERARLRASLDSLADPYVLVEAVHDDRGAIVDFTITEANPAACVFHRMTRDEILGSSLLGPMPAAISDSLTALCIDVLRTAEPQDLNGIHALSSQDDGGDRWYDFRGAPVGDGVSVVWRDVTSRHLSHQAVLDSEQRYRQLAENASDIVLMVDPHDQQIWASPSLQEALGWTPEQLVLRASTEFVHPDDLAGLLGEPDGTVAAPRRLPPFRVQHSNGEYRWISARTRDVVDDAGELVGRIIAVRDVHEETLAQQALQRSEEMFRSVLTSSANGVIICDFSGRIELVNDAVCQLMQRDEDWLVGRFTNDLVHPDDETALVAARALTIADVPRPPAAELRLMRADGSIFWARRTASLIRSAGSPAERLVVQLEDVTDEHLARAQLLFQAFNDRLTGMHNRDWILAELETDLAAALTHDAVVGVLFIDLDNFELINDSLGHVAGDEVLIEVAARLRASLGPTDRVARFGGDEFVVVIPAVSGPAEVERMAESIATAIGTELSIHGHRIVPTVSIGIALSTTDSSSASLLRDTDSALSNAKRSGRAQWRLFDATMHSQAMTRLILEEEIRTALLQGDFVVHYQPIVALADRSIVGYEALVRWQHPERGLLVPAEFLPIAEDSGLIVGIGSAVLDQVCAVLAEHPDAPGPISVNVSAVELACDDWSERFLATLRRYRVEPSRIIVEVTETAVLSLTTHTIASLRAVRDLGAGLHVDDFGTGFSSIALLRDLPVTGLKLDASFVSNLDAGVHDANTLASGLAALVTHLGLTGVAEGIETEVQAEALTRQGWQHGQGYLFGRPAAWASRTG